MFAICNEWWRDDGLRSAPGLVRNIASARTDLVVPQMILMLEVGGSSDLETFDDWLLALSQRVLLARGRVGRRVPGVVTLVLLDRRTARAEE